MLCNERIHKPGFSENAGFLAVPPPTKSFFNELLYRKPIDWFMQGSTATEIFAVGRCNHPEFVACSGNAAVRFVLVEDTAGNAFRILPLGSETFFAIVRVNATSRCDKQTAFGNCSGRIDSLAPPGHTEPVKSFEIPDAQVAPSLSQPELPPVWSATHLTRGVLSL